MPNSNLMSNLFIKSHVEQTKKVKTSAFRFFGFAQYDRMEYNIALKAVVKVQLGFYRLKIFRRCLPCGFFVYSGKIVNRTKAQLFGNLST